MKTLKEKAYHHAVEAFRGFLQKGKAEDLRDAIENAYVTGAAEALAGQWRSVDDELPKEHDEVVVIFTHPYRPFITEGTLA